MARKQKPKPKRRETLADAIARARKAAGDGQILPSAALSRPDRERLERAGWLIRLMRGWYLLAQPGQPGDSTPYYAGYWQFLSRYLGERFGRDYCLSPNDSLRRHLDQNAVPRQVTVMTRGGGTDTLKLPHGTSAVIWQPTDFPARTEVIGDIRVLPLADAIARAPANAWQQDPLEMEIALRQMNSPLEIAKSLVEINSTAGANRIIGAFKFLGDENNAARLRRELEAAGLRIKPENPFQTETPRLGHGNIRIASPYAARVTALWAYMRQTVLNEFSAAPGISKDKRATVNSIEEIYVHDAYHSLSIEGYHVTEELIERVRDGGWDPENDMRDAAERDALAARGYAQAFTQVMTAVGALLDGQKSADIAIRYPDWYRALFQPGVDAGIVNAVDLVGYRNHPVYIRNAIHVPPPPEAVLDAMDAFALCLANEPEPAVRAVLGHFLFTYIHPYMDGNGRIARFLMNTQLISGGFPWTVIRSDRNNRDRYMQALDRASAERNITDFARCVRDNMENPPQSA